MPKKKTLAVSLILLVIAACAVLIGVMDSRDDDPQAPEVVLEASPVIVPIEQLKPATALPKPTLTAAGGPLIFSDSPEMFNEPGAFYRDVAEGEFRVFWHHQNTSNRKMTVAVAFTNESDEAIRLYAKGSGIGTNLYVDIAGQRAMQDFMATLGTKELLAVLEPGDHYFIETPTGAQQTTDGIAQFEAVRKRGHKPASVTVTVLAYDVRPEHPEQMRILPLEENVVRGTFPHFDRIGTIEYDPAMGNVFLAIDAAAAGQWKNDMPGEYEEGWSAVDNAPVINNGNYGVLYHWTVNITNSQKTPQQVNVWLHPSGGFGHYTLKWKNQIHNSGYLDYTRAWNFETVNIGAKGGTYSMWTSLTGGSFGPQTIYFTSEP